MKKTLLCLLITLSVCINAFAADLGGVRRVDYDWQTVTIGAGGFMTGYVFHPKEKGLAYAKGDVGGLWRRGEGEARWNNLSNGFSRNDYWFYGCDGVAVDPNNPDIVYYCAGKYTWSGRGTVFKSYDRGKTWENTGFNRAGFGANEAHRDAGECIMVDPANSNIVYVGTKNGHGLWKSEDAAASWKRVEGIAITDNANNPIRNIEFDPSSMTGRATQRIYVGVKNQGVYRSEDAGTTWELINGDINPVRMQVTNDGTLFVAAGNGLWRLRDGQWEEITPDGKGKTMVDIVVDPDDPDFMVSCYRGSNIMFFPILHSADGGKTWFNVMNGAIKVKNTGYLEDDNFSANTGFLAMDPFNRNHIVFGDWFGLWETFDISARPQVTWEDDNLGIEELCTMGMMSHPDSRYRLLAIAADEDGFGIEDLDILQPRKFTDKYSNKGGVRLMTTTGLDICASDPNFVVRSGANHFGGLGSSYSEDGGDTWKKFEIDPVEPYQRQQGGSRMKFSSNLNPQTGKPNTLVVVQSEAPVRVSNDMGTTWTEAKGVPTLQFGYQNNLELLEKDYSLPDTFYFYDYKTFTVYKSTDGGYNWKEMVKLDAPDSIEGRPVIRSVPDSPGEVWISTGSNTAKGVVGKLYRTYDGFESIEEVPDISKIVCFSFGKAAPERENPALYVYGTIDGKEGIYRSDDMGKNYVRIDEFETFGVGNSPNAMCGDMHDYGVVYISTDGSGIIYGKPAGLELKPISKNDEISSEAGETGAVSAINLTINGKTVKYGTAVVKDGALYYSARELYEALGAEVLWQASDSSVLISRKEYKVETYGNYVTGDVLERKLTISTQNGDVIDDNSALKWKNKAFLHEGKTYIPLKEAMAEWNIDVESGSQYDYELSDKAILTDK